MDIWDLSIQLVAADGEGWEFTYTIADVFFVFLCSGHFSFCAPYIDHALANNKQQFTVYFTSACITLPVSELEKFEQFLRRARVARPVL